MRWGQNAGSRQTLAALEGSPRPISAATRSSGYSDERYPELLKQIFDPPVVLYCKGNVSLLTAPGIAVVGARKPTPYGLAVAERMAIDLASHGLVVTSGMARGVDTAAHNGALQAGGEGAGRTIRFASGCGIDVCYPSENKRLKARIEESGLR